MCGIAGFTGYTNKSFFALEANKIQYHRGPDYQAIWEDDFISLSHQRLSIIDLDHRSNQPFEKHNYIIVYNGEIYNYKEIKKYLEKEYKSVFRTNSDTEVVLEAYCKLKEKCLDLFIGMFSFCIYNKTNNEVFLARDHFGIKPLFYSFKDNKLGFASELKTLVKLGIASKKINKEALVNAINYLWIPNDLCIFEDIKKVLPGNYIIITKEGKITQTEYWSLKEKKININPITFIDRELNKSIDRHLVSDVPVSSFLSGGLDSSLISVLAKNRLKELSTYTIATEVKDQKFEKMPKDSYYAKKLANSFNFKHNEIIINSDIIELLPKIVYTLDEPIGDPAAINTFLISKKAAEKGEKVLLSGMGADEIFFGYRRQLATLWALKFNRLPNFIKVIIRKVINLLPVKNGKKGFKFFRWSKRFMSFTGLSEHETYMRSYSYYSKNELNNLFKGGCAEQVENMYKKHEVIFNSKYKDDIVNKICYTDLKMFMTGLNLTYTDRASMAASVEVRVPFIDKEFVKSAMEIKGNFKIKKKESKYILKKIAEQYLPKNIIYRKKASFGAPIRSWISNDLKEMVDDLLSEKQIKKRNIFNYDFIKNIIEKDRKGEHDYAYQIYQLLTLEIWMQTFID